MKTLTPRERQICALLQEKPELTRRGVGNQIGVSYHTVSFHLRGVYDKLGVSSKPAWPKYTMALASLLGAHTFVSNYGAAELHIMQAELVEEIEYLAQIGAPIGDHGAIMTLMDRIKLAAKEVALHSTDSISYALSWINEDVRIRIATGDNIESIYAWLDSLVKADISEQ